MGYRRLGSFTEAQTSKMGPWVKPAWYRRISVAARGWHRTRWSLPPPRPCLPPHSPAPRQPPSFPSPFSYHNVLVFGPRVMFFFHQDGDKKVSRHRRQDFHHLALAGGGDQPSLRHTPRVFHWRYFHSLVAQPEEWLFRSWPRHPPRAEERKFRSHQRRDCDLGTTRRRVLRLIILGESEGGFERYYAPPGILITRTGPTPVGCSPAAPELSG